MESITLIDFIKENPIFLVLGVLLLFLIALQFKTKNLDGIKNRRAGQGQFGTARFMTPKEKNEIFKRIKFEPELWRKGKNLDKLPEGTIWGTEARGKDIIALVDIDDRNGMMIGPAGVGKTGHFFIPNMEYASAVGMSMLSTDTKGDLYRNIGQIQKKYYQYEVVVLDFRNPLYSDRFNLIGLVNEYMDKSKESESDVERLMYSSKAEKYAKIVSKSIIESSGFTGGGNNAYFYDAAEGLLTASIMLVSEYGEKDERHIISVFKVIQELSEIEKGKEGVPTNRFAKLAKLLPENHKAKWFAGSAIEADVKTAMSTISTALSRLTKFIDSELEQMLCFDGKFNAKKFSEEKMSVFIVLPEEDATKHFMLGLFLNQIYRELLSIADERGGKLPKRVMMFEDEFGTIPAIKDVDMMFSASRSRGILSIPIIQSFAQLRDKYGKEKSEIIFDNCQNLIFSGFAPTSKAPEELSKAMDNYTIQTGNISEGSGGKGNRRQVSYSMTGRALMTPDEIRRIPKGNYVVMRTGSHPFKTKLPLFFKWGIKLEKEQYKMDKNIDKVSYLSADTLEERILSLRVEELNKQKAPNKETTGDREVEEVENNTSEGNVNENVNTTEENQEEKGKSKFKKLH